MCMNTCEFMNAITNFSLHVHGSPLNLVKDPLVIFLLCFYCIILLAMYTVDYCNAQSASYSMTEHYKTFLT